MRKALIVLAGIVMVGALLVGPLRGDGAAFDTCTAQGIYNLSALADVGSPTNMQALGFMTLVQPSACTTGLGTFSAEVDVKPPLGGQTHLILAGTYFIDANGVFTTNIPTVNLTGDVTQVAGGIANTIVFVANFGGSVVLAGVAVRNPPVGFIGPTGPSGPSGPSGPAGPSGVSGASGPSGVSGASGPSGVSGASGPSGVSGPSGPIQVLNINTDTANSASSTSVLDAYTFTVPANTLGTNKAIACQLLGDYLNNSGSAADLTITLKYGGTTVATRTPTIPSRNRTGDVEIEFKLAAKGSASLQRGKFYAVIDRYVSGLVLGNTATTLDKQDLITTLGGGAATENSTTSLVLALQIQHGTSSANITFNKYYAICLLESL